MPDQSEAGPIDPRDHRLDLLEQRLEFLDRRSDERWTDFERLRGRVDSLEDRALIRRALTPLERSLLDEQIERSLAQDVVTHFRRASDRGRRARLAGLAAILAAAAAIGSLVSKLLPHF